MIVVCKSIVEEALFEWSHHNVLSTDTKVRTIIIHSDGERAKYLDLVFQPHIFNTWPPFLHSFLKKESFKT